MKNDEIEILERQGCFSTDWSKVSIAEGCDLGRIRNVFFNGPVSVGKGTEIINVPGGIRNVRIGENVRIVNVARIENTPGATFGIGIDVAVLDETGGRPVRIYPGISAQTATIAARKPGYARDTLFPMIDRYIASLPDMPEIGDGAEIRDCGPIIDVRIRPGVKVEGAAWLRNGSIVSNAPSHLSRGAGDKSDAGTLAYVGQGVNAENFIIEDACVANGVMLRNTYVGQGCVLDKGFTSHDSIFFANCALENGEACAVLAGPYTVSMHKSSLLIGCQTSFMNAGSATNMSNHMYKLGPVHWGVLERGVKTSSNSYLMHGSRIGAYSLVMGEHKTHPDSSCFPFSYLFGDGKGNSIVVPGAMLKSYGLKRDAAKWPKRDRREGKVTRISDRIDFNIFNPITAGQMLNAIDLIDRLLLEMDEGDDTVRYKGLTISRTSLEKGRRLYDLALHKYFHSKSVTPDNPTRKKGVGGDRWIDLAGLPIPESRLNEALGATSLEDLEKAFDRAFEATADDEVEWLEKNLRDRIDEKEARRKAEEFDAEVEKDRIGSIDLLLHEEAALSEEFK